jgi:phage shock protein E
MGWRNMLESLRQKANLAPAGARGQAAASDGKAKYHRISPQDAKAVLDAKEPVTVLDVREPSEYKAGYIANAVLLPSGSVASMAEQMLPDKNARILVYCLSGRRSGAAARQLVRLGYTRVYDFGGIADWPYGVVMN